MAKALIDLSRPAKFGRKEKTILDRKVRDAWEIPADRIEVASPGRKSYLEGVLATVFGELHMPEGSRLTAHLHNLLIYERGQFFSAHQDSEKMDGMVATLVVLLPSKFSGGALVIDQHGDKKTFENPVHHSENLNIMAFYADCHHSVEKVTAGYRIALTYNLVLENPPDLELTSKNSGLTRNLRDYFCSQDSKLPLHRHPSPRWLVYLLDHQYTQKSLTWKNLKGADRTSASQLLRSASDLGLEVHLALADVHEVWSAENDFHSRGRRRYWDDSEDDDDDSQADAENMELGEIVVNECSLNHWMDAKGQPKKFGSKYVDDSMICWTKATDEFSPLKTEYEGYMGNYGNTVDKWYHRAAIVLWTKDNHYASLFEIDPCSAVLEVTDLCVKNLANGRNAVRQILPLWKNIGLNDLSVSSKVFKLASLVHDQSLSESLLGSAPLAAFSNVALPSFIQLINEYGETWCVEQLSLLANAGSNNRGGPTFISDLKVIVHKLSLVAPKVTAWLLAYQFGTIVSSDQVPPSMDYGNPLRGSKKRLQVAREFLTSSVRHVDFISLAVKHILKHSELYQPIDLVDLAVTINDLALEEPCKSVAQSIAREATQQLEVIASASREKGDWSIRVPVICKCHDCAELREFLENSTTCRMVWPLAKQRRQHIHNAIGGMGLPVTHVTQRVGSPQKLVLCKTLALFEIKATKKALAVDALKQLKRLCPTTA